MTPSNAVLAARLRAIRSERFGEGLAALAEAVGVPKGTWRNYESGVTIPGPVLLRFIDATGASPRWLFDGEGPMLFGGCGSRPLIEVDRLN
jgi:transcriptional regulator with XRE-family HTH domain